MIEATCGACGTVARIPETDVPVGAKFVTCASCKARVALPQQGAAPGKPPAKPGAIPPALPKMPPAIPKPSMSSKPTVDLADLPAPKRNSPLAGIDAPKAPPRSPLDGAELPAPKSAKPATPSALDLDDLMPPELPAPKAKSDVGLADLPAPRPRQSALSDAPPSKPVSSAFSDLPAPKAKPSPLGELPAPKAKSALGDLPAPKAKPALDLGDLPTPKAKPALDLGDLPTPKAKPSIDLDDLPAPKDGGDSLSFDDELDLPMPSGGFSDLPMPKPGANSDLVMPKPGANSDLVMPKAGANQDYVTPKPGGGSNSDLPAPKGFFDDLPQVAKKQGGIDLPAPKGFFDDLPQPALNKGPDLPAPKGFFDDLPQPAKASSQAASGGGGFFDDLPQPKAGAQGAAPGGMFDDMPQPPAKGGFGNDLDLGLAGDRPLSLEGDPLDADLDLGLPISGDQQFTDLDLSAPTTGPSARPQEPAEPDSPIKIKTPKGGKPQTPIAITVKKDGAGPGGEIKLDLADDPHNGKGEAAATAGKAGPKRKGKSAEEIAEDKAKSRKRNTVVLGGVLGLALLGGGGFHFYQKHAAAQERQAAISASLDDARKSLGAASPNHWQKAANAAAEVLEKEPNLVAALGLGAEAAIAGALDNGQNFDARIKHGRKLVQQGIGVGKASTELERAQALMAIAAGQSDRAIPTLQKLMAEKPKDGWLQLYMGWAQLVKGDAAAAQLAFEQAVALDAATKLPALYGHGQAKLMKADLEGARSDFATVLETDKAHVGAQIGLAATLPPQQSSQREAELLSILQRTDLDKQDPRAVVKAWTLVGHVARTGGRLDIARERYRKALAIAALDLDALTGLAAVELRDGKIQIARDLLQKALTQNPNDAEGQLLDAYADVLEGKLPDAEGKLAKLAARQPPLPTLQLARLHVVQGRLFETAGKDEEAIAEYIEGAKLAGDQDLTPTMSAVIKLTDLAKKAPDEATAMGYRARADQLLQTLAERAREDAELSMTLGVAYLEAGDAAKAETFLRRSVTMRDKDPESRLQLGKALVTLNRIDDAIAVFKEALALDPKRGDVALELARTYQTTGRHTEAVAAYEKLLTGENVDSIVRVNAGRYFASRGAFDKAAAQAEPILKAEPENAGGLYLKGEGLILAKNWDDARRTLTRATDLDQSDAQALDALGRAFEGSLEGSGDTKFVEGARHAYERATKADPKLFHAHLGLGRMLVAAGHFDEAIKALAAASALDKGNSQVMYTMGVAFYGVRSQSPAHKKTSADWFENALNSRPELSNEDKAEAHYKLGDLYFDLNKPAQSAQAWDTATRLGEQIEKDGGKSPKWLTETFYRLGQVYEGQAMRPQQKRAWQRYLARNPAPSEQKKAAEYAINTVLKTF